MRDRSQQFITERDAAPDIASLIRATDYVALSLLVLFVNKPPSMTASGGDAH
ncbi:hypothetical protein J2R78_005622 [Bradyrhizobium sp. USDA 4538]|uniref:hypothetical protein n=1 Tax=unclassified Bradyrhizobium TaxID=2631580 RepID=UPI0020A00558|nr:MULTISPECIES: hypothetical protein [unclassified Bradyrhizobium]MCP1842655.1 hypothetical protein [Bradyrhizobium sp. USDA 4538]MCP1903219.1 hypothetical protein [Bradyrhizobium sp. USDA 4537]MCP1991124.1 hypothetical protein [Bradyrhizobium sp. USDA 4539]